MVFACEPQGREAQGDAFQSLAVAPPQPFITIDLHGFAQRERLARGVRHVSAPAKRLLMALDQSLVVLDRHGIAHALCAARRAWAIGPDRTLLDLTLNVDREELSHLMLSQNHLYRRTQRGFVRELS